LARIVTSSAYALIWLNFVNIVLLLSTFSIAVCRIILNSVVDKPSPCFTPLLCLNSRPNSFSIFTFAYVSVNVILARFTSFFGILIPCMLSTNFFYLR
jgi:hypothetical protein